MLDGWIQKVKRELIPGFVWIEIYSLAIVERSLDFSSVVGVIHKLNAIPRTSAKLRLLLLRSIGQ